MEDKKVTLEEIEESQNLAKEGYSSYDLIDEGYKFKGTTIGIGLGVLLIAIGGGIVGAYRFIKGKVEKAKEKKKAKESEETTETKETEPGE